MIAVLALMQGALGILRSFELFHIGADLIRRGILVLPLIGGLTLARGAVVAVIALLYVLFVLGVLMGRGWAWWLGLFVAAVNGLGALSLLIEGESIGRALFWVIVPVILVWYLLSPAGRRAFQR